NREALQFNERKDFNRASTWRRRTGCPSAIWRMAQTVCVVVSAEDRARLAAIIGDRSRPLKHMQRARIVLQSADRLPALEISRRAGVSRPAVWRWQRHYAEEGVERLLREGSRKPGKAPVAVATVAKV